MAVKILPYLLIQLPGGKANDHKNTHDVPIVAYRRARQGEGTYITASGVAFDALLPSVVTITGKDVTVDCSSVIFCKAVRGTLIVKHNCTTDIQCLQRCYIIINHKSRNSTTINLNQVTFSYVYFCQMA